MHPKDLSDLDQSAATLIELLPNMWAGLFKNLISNGVPEDHALQMVLTYITATCELKNE